MTPEQRLLTSWKRKIDERNDLMDSLEYTLDNFESVDKLVANTEKLFKQYKAIKEEVEKQDEASITTEGGSVLSLSDLDMI